MHSLLILGEKHTFSDLEKVELSRHFTNIHYIKYKNVEVTAIIEKFDSFTKEHKPTLVLLNNKALIPHEFLNYLSSLNKEHIDLISIQNFMEKYLLKCFIPPELIDISFLEKSKPFNKSQLAFKFTIDYLSSIGILLLTSPVMLYAIYKIKKESPGPILFQQKRVGKNGKEFTCLKFRSMKLDAEKDGAKFATENDERVYPWGRVMRSTRIDELPQLWNVLRGEMHLIGPRPERKVWIDQFEKTIPYYNERHTIKPGLTGWAQVLYPYGENAYDAKQKLMYDLYYIKHWSLWLELKTVWKTIRVILSRKGL